MDAAYILAVVAAMAAVTFALRALPFVASRWLERHPVVQRLGKFLPLAIMALLVVHTVVGTSQENPAGPWPELLAVALVVGAQWFQKNALLSMLLGTGVYVVLRNLALF